MVTDPQFPARRVSVDAQPVRAPRRAGPLRAIVFAGLALAAGTAFAQAPPPPGLVLVPPDPNAWSAMIDAEDDFRAEFPVAPGIFDNSTVDDPQFATVHDYMTSSSIGVLAISVGTYHPGVAPDAAVVFAEILAGLQQECASVTDAEFAVDDGVAREMIGRCGDRDFTRRYYIAAGRLYAVTALGEPGFDAGEQAVRFLAAFQVTPGV